MKQMSIFDDSDHPVVDDEFDDAFLEAALREGRERTAAALRYIRRPQARVGMADSPLGQLLVAESERGLLTVRFLRAEPPEQAVKALARRFDLAADDKVAERVVAEITRHLGGDDAGLSRPIDLALVEGDFMRRVLTQLRKVPRGAVVTYAGLAAVVGAPQSQRAVGNAMASNPLPPYIPCHRVIRSDGSVGNYGGGPERKVQLLRAEGFHVGPDRRLPARSVVGNRQTHIYCRPECRTAQRANLASKLLFSDSASASRSGMRPCRLCAPG